MLAIILGYFALPSMVTLCSRLIVWKANEIVNPIVTGSIDSILIDQRGMVSLSSGVQVSPGGTILLTGWMKSNLSKEVPPKVVLLSTNQAIPECEFSTTTQLRPDVVQHENDPDLLQSGFNAILQLSNHQPLGEYYIKVIRSDEKLSQFYLPCIVVRVTLPSIKQNKAVSVPGALEKPKNNKKNR